MTCTRIFLGILSVAVSVFLGGFTVVATVQLPPEIKKI